MTGREMTAGEATSGVHVVVACWLASDGCGDRGAGPNKLVAITDPLNATSPGSWERFHTVRPARFGQVIRGVSFTPGTR
jgi:hypothetical protein